MFISKSEFFKDNKLHKPVGRVQFVVFEKFTSACLQQIAREFMLLPVNNIHENAARSQDGRTFGNAHALFVICIFVT